MKRVIFGADDFGSSEAVNRGVERAFREGNLTSCSLMAAGEAFKEAVAVSQRNPALAVGVHLVFCMGRSVLPPERIPNLVDERGRFRNNPVAAGLAYMFAPGIRRQIEAEMRAQIEKVLDAGIQVSHLDSHLHMHVHPVIFALMVRLGEEYRIKRVRVPSEPLLTGDRLSMVFPTAMLNMLSVSMKWRLSSRGFHFNDYVFGVRRSGDMSEDYVLRVLRDLPEGTGEIYFHPADLPEGSPPLEPMGPNAVDLKTLLSARVRSALNQMGIVKTSYLGLEKSA